MKSLRLPPIWILNGFASFCLMLIQVLSGRALAPFLGTSVFTWTSVIGATLIGLTFGQAAGGALADRKSGRRALAQTFLMAGSAALAANFALAFFSARLSTYPMDLAFRSIMLAIVVFTPVAFFLSMVGPQLAKLAVDNLGHSGSIVGKLSAAGAIGSLLGVGLGGYVLISALGTQYLMSAVAIALLGLGVYIGVGERVLNYRIAGFLGVVVISNLLLPGLCKQESNYYCIRILAAGTEEAPRFTLKLDHLVHSYVSPRDPADLGYGYEQVYARLIATRYSKLDSFHAYFIGGGGFVLPRYLESYYPSATSTVSEIDPAVIEANHRFMELSTSTKIVMAPGDARRHLMRNVDEPYDLVFGDAFNDFGVPVHLTTLEFHQLLKSRMKPDGMYALNLIDDSSYGNFLTSMTRTLRQVWKYVEVAPLADTLEPGRNTIVLIASDEPLDKERWLATRPPSFDRLESDDKVIEASSKLLDPAIVEEFLSSHPNTPVLTDDYVPIDRYLAPVFRDAY
ncbi:fused MFS/spermidine synthase [Candidatus Uhrbacteria bacterium]|nr:fused MFS/spermidine synthase [Candidatus Uhrbacteria bacterium]